MSGVAEAARVRPEGFVCGIACNSAEPTSEYTKQAAAELDSQGKGISGFDDLIYFDASGKVATSQFGKAVSPGSLVPPIDTPPVKGNQSIVQNVKAAEARVNHPKTNATRSH